MTPPRYRSFEDGSHSAEEIDEMRASLPRVQRTNVRRLYEQAIATGDDMLLRGVQDYLVGRGWIGGAPGQLDIEEAITEVERDA